MKKYSTRLLSVLIMICIIGTSFSSFSAGAIQSEKPHVQRTETKDGIHYVGPTGDVAVDADDVPVVNAKDYQDVAPTAALPAFVDNSDSPYFPKIGSQGQLGSCQYWAQVYYQFTYEMNRKMGVATTPENSFSPQWTYNIVAGTDDVIGAYFDVFTAMKVQGNVFLSQVPYTLDTASYSPAEDIWKTSINYRLKDYEKFDDVGVDDKIITSVDDEDLTAIKSSLVNGDVITYSTYIESWNITRLKKNDAVPENAKFENQEVVRYLDGTNGPHRMTLVGYNDNIWTDINDNNTVDDGEMGAFKIANSWGDYWANKGFMWIAYDALNEVSVVDSVTSSDDRESVFSEMTRIDVMQQGEDAQLYLKYTINTADRTQVRLIISAERDGTPYSRQVYSNVTHGDAIAYDGSTDATDATMVALLSNVVPGITSEELEQFNWSVSFEDTKADDTVLTVKDVQIVDETAGKVYTVENTYPLTLDGEKKTVEYTKSNLNHAVVYYYGYDNPKISYKVDDGDFVSDNMIYKAERRGYVYKYVIDLKEHDSATLYFSDENGNTDDNSGEYFIAEKGLNYYKTEGVGSDIEGTVVSDVGEVADVDTGCVFSVTAEGGYAPYKYRFIITNLDTNEKVEEAIKDEPEFVHYFRQEGVHEIAAEIIDFTDTVKVVKTNIEIKDIALSFKELCTDKMQYFVGDTVTLSSTTQNENIRYAGVPMNKYDFVIKDEQGDTCHNSTVLCKKYDLMKRFTQASETFVPHKSGTYTATVSTTDGNGDFAQISTTFVVTDKIYGDADFDGVTNIFDVTHIQRYIAKYLTDDEINTTLADCDLDGIVNIFDATHIQRYLAGYTDCEMAGKVIEYIPPTQEETEAPTQEPTQPTSKSTVTFTDSFNWGGTLYCYYWSDSNKSMVSWPGKAMTSIGKNDYQQTMYTFNVPSDATYLIFTNGSAQTTDISYGGGEVRYYPVEQTDTSGHNLVNTW